MVANRVLGSSLSKKNLRRQRLRTALAICDLGSSLSEKNGGDSACDLRLGHLNF